MNALQRRCVALVIVCLTSFAAPGWAAWPSDPATNLAVCTAPGNQHYPFTISDGAGGAFLAWGDSRRVGSDQDYDVFAQHVLWDGRVDPRWPAGGLAIVTLPGDQDRPSLLADGRGGVYVAWFDLRSYASEDAGCYVQHVLGDARIDPAWPVDGLRVARMGSAPMIVSDGSGGLILAGNRSTGLTGIQVLAQHVLRNGVVDPAWPGSGVPLSGSIGDRNANGIAPDDAGGAYVVWEDLATGSSQRDILAQHVLADGTVDPAWPGTGAIVGGAAGLQGLARMIPDGAGGALVAWDDRRVAGESDVYAHHLLPSGVDAAWPVNGLAVCTVPGRQSEPTLASDGAGGAVIAWIDGRNESGGIPFAQRIGPAGQVMWAAGGVALAKYESIEPRVVPDGAHGAIVTWVDGRHRYDGDDASRGWDLDAQRVTGDGTLAWAADGVPVCTAPRDQDLPATVADGVGGAIAVWQDERSHENGDYERDIYADRLAPSGVLGGDVALEVTLRVLPRVLEPGGKGDVTVSVAPPAPYSASEIDVRSIRLNGAAPAAFAARLVAAANGTRELMLKFERRDVVDGRSDTVVRLALTGTVGGVPFAGHDSILVRRATGRPAPRPGQADASTVRDELRLTCGMSPRHDGPARVTFSLPASDPATLRIYDVSGRVIESRDVGNRAPGSYEMVVGRSLEPGLYLVRLVQRDRDAKAKLVVF